MPFFPASAPSAPSQAGPRAGRPSAPAAAAGAAALYWSTDQDTLDVWDGAAWQALRGGATIKSESWDSVTAPAIPAGWQVDTPLATASTPAAASAPNALVYPAAAGNPAHTPRALWTTQDGQGGDVQVSASVHFASLLGADHEAWLLARGAAAANWSVPSYYAAGLVAASGALYVYLSKSVDGAQTNLLSGLVPGASGGATYRLVLSCLGSALAVRVQRQSDGSWLRGTGTWVADPTGVPAALAAHDTAMGGAGYAGLFFWFADTTGGDVSVDDWLLEGTGGGIPLAQKGASAGLAMLDSHGFVPLGQLSAGGGVSVKSYGATGDGITDDTAAITAAAAAVAAGVSPGPLFFPPGTYVTGAQTFAATVSVHMQPGALLQHGSSTLTFTGLLQAAPSQIFSGSGPVLLAPGSVAHVYPEWWGARSAGSTDDSAAVQAAAQAVSAPTNGHGVVRFLPATYHFAAPVECPPQVEFVGAGVDQNGAAGTVISLADGCDGFTWTTAESHGTSAIAHLAIAGGRHALNAANLSSAVSFVHLRDIATFPTSGAGIHLQGAIEEWYVERWFHLGGLYGVQMEDIGVPTDAVQASYVDKSHFVDCGIAGGTNCIKWFCKQGNDVTFEHCVFGASQQHAIWLDGGLGGYRFVNCTTEACGNSGKNGNTTGSISSGSTALAVASAVGFAVGDTVIVRGAAAHGLDLSTQVSAITGTTLTLADAASATVAGVRVTNAQYDEIYVSSTVAAVVNICVAGGSWGSNYTNQLRYWLNNGGARFEISPETFSATEGYDAYNTCIAPSSRVALVRPSDQYLAWGSGIFAPTAPSGSAGERASYPSVPGGDWEAVLQTSRSGGAGTLGPSGWLFRVAATVASGYVVAQLFPDGTFAPTRIANRAAAMVGATPDVSDADAYLTSNPTATTVTAFTNGRQGQEIRIIFGEWNTTIQNNASIVTSAADIVGVPGRSVSFLLLNGVWYRTGGTA